MKKASEDGDLQVRVGRDVTAGARAKQPGAMEALVALRERRRRAGGGGASKVRAGLDGGPSDAGVGGAGSAGGGSGNRLRRGDDSVDDGRRGTRGAAAARTRTGGAGAGRVHDAASRRGGTRRGEDSARPSRLTRPPFFSPTVEAPCARTSSPSVSPPAPLSAPPAASRPCSSTVKSRARAARRPPSTPCGDYELARAAAAGGLGAVRGHAQARARTTPTRSSC